MIEDFSAPPPSRRGTRSPFCPPSFPCSRSGPRAAHRWMLKPTALRYQVIVLRCQRLPPPSALNRPFVLGVALPGAASTPRYLVIRQTGDRDRMALQGLSHLLALASTRFRTIQDECRNPRPDWPDALCPPALGRTSHSWQTARARHRGWPVHSRDVGLPLTVRLKEPVTRNRVPYSFRLLDFLYCGIRGGKFCG